MRAEHGKRWWFRCDARLFGVVRLGAPQNSIAHLDRAEVQNFGLKVQALGLARLDGGLHGLEAGLGAPVLERLQVAGNEGLWKGGGSVVLMV